MLCKGVNKEPSKVLYTSMTLTPLQQSPQNVYGSSFAELSVSELYQHIRMAYHLEWDQSTGERLASLSVVPVRNTRPTSLPTPGVLNPGIQNIAPAASPTETSPYNQQPRSRVYLTDAAKPSLMCLHKSGPVTGCAWEDHTARAGAGEWCLSDQESVDGEEGDDGGGGNSLKSNIGVDKISTQKRKKRDKDLGEEFPVVDIQAAMADIGQQVSTELLTAMHELVAVRLAPRQSGIDKKFQELHEEIVRDRVALERHRDPMKL
ncbi:hypothetical protein BZA77DRAFT_296620 [Pyronema omphalodes]|nr:hypothetical protein BZA77DRAFT_296620 [Pyronema omphalodes]